MNQSLILINLLLNFKIPQPSLSRHKSDKLDVCVEPAMLSDKLSAKMRVEVCFIMNRR